MNKITYMEDKMGKYIMIREQQAQERFYLTKVAI